MIKLVGLVKESLKQALPKKKWLDVDADQHADDLIDLVQTAYKKAPKGSFVNTKSDLVGSDWHSIDFDDQPDVDATIFYREARSEETWTGKKIQGLGHDGSRESIQILLKRLNKLLHEKGAWVEASDAMEHVLYKAGVPYVKDEGLARSIFPNTNLKFLGDRGKYVRDLDSSQAKETIFGIPQLS